MVKKYYGGGSPITQETNEMSDGFDLKTASFVGGIGVAAAAIFAIGHWWGSGAVLESAVLKAENAVLYQLVTVQSSAPTEQLLSAATRVCEEENDPQQSDCMKDFLDRYGDVWVVNLVEGSRVLLTPENADYQAER